MIDNLKPFLGDFALEPAASETSLDLLKKRLGYDLPDDYLSFLALPVRAATGNLTEFITSFKETITQVTECKMQNL